MPDRALDVEVKFVRDEDDPPGSGIISRELVGQRWHWRSSSASASFTISRLLRSPDLSIANQLDCQSIDRIPPP
jgi:hypothetical protein